MRCRWYTCIRLFSLNNITRILTLLVCFKSSLNLYNLFLPCCHSPDEGIPVSGEEAMHDILKKALLSTFHDIDTEFSRVSTTL